MVPIGARVRELRKARGLRMKALPFSRAYLSRLELGGFLPGPDRIAALAESLGVSARTLLGSEEEWQLGQLSDPFILEGLVASFTIRPWLDSMLE